MAASPNTVRNDLNALAAEGLVRRVRGGAALAEEASGPAVPPERRLTASPSEAQLACWAAALVEDGDAIALDSSPVALELAACLRNRHHLTVVAAGRALDLTRCIAIPFTGDRVHSASQGFEYSFDWWTFTVTKRPYKNVEHLAECVRRDIDGIYDAMAHGRLTADAALVAQLTASDAQTPEEVHEVFAKICKALGDCVLIHPESIVGLTTAYVRAGWDLFIYLMGDEPELVDQWLEALCAYEVQRIHGIADRELSPIAMVADDIAGKQGLFFSPKWLRKHWIPLTKRCVDAWHEHGVKVIYHSDGDKMEILDDLVNIGIDAINPIEPTVGMSIAGVRKRYPDLVVTSMIDCDQLLPYGTPEEVEAACKEAIDEGARGGSFLLGSSSELHPEAKLENFLKMLEVAHTYGCYANKDQWRQPSWA